MLLLYDLALCRNAIYELDFIVSWGTNKEREGINCLH